MAAYPPKVTLLTFRALHIGFHMHAHHCKGGKVGLMPEDQVDVI